MKRTALWTSYVSAVLVAGALVAGPVLADKPDWAGGGDKKGKSHERDRDKGAGGGEQKGKGQERDRAKGAGGAAVQGKGGGSHFTDQHRLAVREFYAGEFRAGKCPPGLAKKRNGCMPPGQAKKWSVGRPLPRDVVFYDLPPALVVQIGPPPQGYRYVRVAADILMIAVGTGIVMGAIEDLGRM